MYGPVQVDLARGVARQAAEVPLDVLERAVHVDARVLGVVALPHRDRRSPVAVAADRPVARALEPLAELSVLDVLGHPGDLLVVLDQAVLDRGDAHEPARDGLVDQRVAAAPAVRVRVLVAREAQQAPVLTQDAHERRVRVHPQLARDIRHLRQEASAVVEAHDERDAGGLGDSLVVLAVGRGLVDDAGAVAGRDVVVDEDPPGAARCPRSRHPRSSRRGGRR